MYVLAHFFSKMYSVNEGQIIAIALQGPSPKTKMVRGDVIMNGATVQEDLVEENGSAAGSA